MKIRLNNKPAGVVLLVALLVIVVSGIVLASYLKLMQSENKSVARSQIWNKCVPIMEAGVEEAFAQIHACNNSTNLSSNGWTYTLVGTNYYYQKTRNISTNGSYCVISITPTQPPIIYSTAYVPIPDTSTNYITRKVRVNTTNYFISPGLLARGTISMSGGAIVDSYNSTVGPYTSSPHGTNALVVTDSTAPGAISLLKGGTIYGLAETGPGGNITCTGGASVGPNGSTGCTSGWTNNTANIQINDAPMPATNVGIWSSSTVSGTMPSTGSTNYTYLLNNANYIISTNVAMGGGNTRMGVMGNVQLYVPAGLSTANSAYIYIAANSSLTIYVGGSFNIAGAGIANGASSTSALTIYGLNNCTDVTIGNSGQFYGYINAPYAAVNLSGDSDLYGAFIGSSITVGGSAKVHYDQALGATNGTYALGWNEL